MSKFVRVGLREACSLALQGKFVQYTQDYKKWNMFTSKTVLSVVELEWCNWQAYEHDAMRQRPVDTPHFLPL